MTGNDIKRFWESDFASQYKDKEKILNYAQQDVDKAKKLFSISKEIENLDFYDAVACLGDDMFFEDSKTIGRTYNINIYAPIAYVSAFWACVYYLIPFVQSFDPGFPYKITLNFDEQRGLDAFLKVLPIVNHLATTGHNLLSVECVLDPAEERVKRGAYLAGAR